MVNSVLTVATISLRHTSADRGTGVPKFGRVSFCWLKGGSTHVPVLAVRLLRFLCDPPTMLRRLNDRDLLLCPAIFVRSSVGIGSILLSAQKVVSRPCRWSWRWCVRQSGTVNSSLALRPSVQSAERNANDGDRRAAGRRSSRIVVRRNGGAPCRAAGWFSPQRAALARSH